MAATTAKEIKNADQIAQEYLDRASSHFHNQLFNPKIAQARAGIHVYTRNDDYFAAIVDDQGASLGRH